MEEFMEHMMHQPLLGMTVGAWCTLAVLITLYVALLRSWLTSTVSLIIAATVLFCLGIVGEHDMLEAFGSEPVLVHAAFFIIIAGMIATGSFFWFSNHVLRTPDSYVSALLRVMIPSSVMSMAMGSINVTALYIDVLKLWARRLMVSPTRLLMPLSFAATLGGLCTLLGTSSNLVVASLYAEATDQSMSLFEPFVPGLIVAVVGVGMTMAMRNLIPDRQSPEQSFESTSDYTVELLVPTDNEAVGCTVDEAGLRNVRGGSLVEIVRFDKEVISPVPSDEFILGGDRLVYSGMVNEILELKKTHNLAAATHHVFSVSEIGGERTLRTAYINFGSSLIGTQMCTNGFEEAHNVVLVAVARQGHRVDGLPREIELQAGDSLLFDCQKGEERKVVADTRHQLTFFDSQFVPRNDMKTVVSGVIFMVVLLLSLFQVMSLLAATMLGAALMMVARCCRCEKITEYIEWDVLLRMGSVMVFSTAVSHSQLGAVIANGVLSIVGSNPLVVLLLLCLTAAVLSEFILSAGVAAIFFPIFHSVALDLGVDPMAFAIALMLSVGSSMALPMGSVTHMLVFSAGGFRFSDFARLGVVMHLVLVLVGVLAVSVIYGMV